MSSCVLQIWTASLLARALALLVAVQRSNREIDIAFLLHKGRRGRGQRLLSLLLLLLLLLSFPRLFLRVFDLQDIPLSKAQRVRWFVENFRKFPTLNMIKKPSDYGGVWFGLWIEMSSLSLFLIYKYMLCTSK